MRPHTHKQALKSGSTSWTTVQLGAVTGPHGGRLRREGGKNRLNYSQLPAARRARALGDVGFVLPEWGCPPRRSTWLAVLPAGWPGGLELTPCLYTVEKAAKCLHAVNRVLARLAPELAETWSAREAQEPRGRHFPTSLVSGPPWWGHGPEEARCPS